MTSHSSSRLGRLLYGAFGAAVFALTSTSSFAMQAHVTKRDSVQTRNGVIVQPGPANISAPGLPIQVPQEGQNTVTGGEGGPSVSTYTGTITVQFSAISDPGDPVGASLCIGYEYSANTSGVVTVSPGSAAGGAGGLSGFSLDSSSSPATATVPNPATLVVTPSVGPVRTIFSLGPATLATTGALQTTSLAQSGYISIQAGDTVDFQTEAGFAIRGEPTAGSASGAYSQSIAFSQASPQACSGPVAAATPVPVFGRGAVTLLAISLSGLGLVVLRRRNKLV
jgi:hypothetical protein